MIFVTVVDVIMKNLTQKISFVLVILLSVVSNFS